MITMTEWNASNIGVFERQRLIGDFRFALRGFLCCRDHDRKLLNLFQEQQVRNNSVTSVAKFEMGSPSVQVLLKRCWKQNAHGSPSEPGEGENPVIL